MALLVGPGLTIVAVAAAYTSSQIGVTSPPIPAVADSPKPTEKPFGERWERIVPIPMAELGEGDRYVIWVEGGWLQIRRETSLGLTDWHIVLARATSPEPPIIEAIKGTVRFALSYRGGR